MESLFLYFYLTIMTMNIGVAGMISLKHENCWSVNTKKTACDKIQVMLRTIVAKGLAVINLVWSNPCKKRKKNGFTKAERKLQKTSLRKNRRSCKTFQDFVRLHQVSVCSWSREWIVWTLQDSLSHLGQRLFLSAKSLPTNEKVDSGQEKHYLKWCYCDQWSYL